MAITVVQSNSGGGSVQNEPVAFLSNNTAGNLLVALSNSTFNATPSVTDTAGNSWQLRGTDITTRGLSVFYVLSAKGGANTVTANYGASVQQALSIIEVSAGAGLVWVADGTYTAVNIGGSGTAVTGNPLTLTHSNAILLSQVGVLSAVITITQGASWVKQQTYADASDNIILQTQIASASGSYTPTATLSASGFWDIDISGFAAVAAPGPPATTAQFPLPVYKAIGIL